MASSDRPGLTPEQLLEVLPNIEITNRRWERKVKLISVIGRWGTFHEISNRALYDRTGVSPHLMTELLQELIEARIVTCVYAPEGGRRPGIYFINPLLEQWGRTSRGKQVTGGVPWRVPVAAVNFWTFHVEQPDHAKPGSSRAFAMPSRRKPSQRREGDPDTRDGKSQRREDDPDTRDGDTPARGIRAGIARREHEDAQSVPLTGPEGELSSSLTTGTASDGDDADAGWRLTRQKVIAAAVPVYGKPKFLNGDNEKLLRELFNEHGADSIDQWLRQAPNDLGVPMLIAWIEDQAKFQPSPEWLEELEELRRARAQAEAIEAGDFGATSGGMGDAPNEPSAPRLPEFRAPEHAEHQPTEAGRSGAAAARRALGKPTPNESSDDRMSTSTGGTHR